jgi:hypothetical protein
MFGPADRSAPCVFEPLPNFCNLHHPLWIGYRLSVSQNPISCSERLVTSRFEVQDVPTEHEDPTWSEDKRGWECSGLQVQRLTGPGRTGALSGLLWEELS